MIEVMTFGANKYGDNNWRDVKDGKQRYLAALLRHLAAKQMGEIFDLETGLKHDFHILCNAAFLAELGESDGTKIKNYIIPAGTDITKLKG